MDINEIKKLIEIEGGKFVIIEDGRPTIIIMAFDEYQKNLRLPFPDTAETDKNKKLKANSLDNASYKESEQLLKIEDLPL